MEELVRPILLDELLPIELGPVGLYGLPALEASGLDAADERVSLSLFPPPPKRPSNPPPLPPEELPDLLEVEDADRLADEADLSSFLSPPRPNRPPMPFLPLSPLASALRSSVRVAGAGEAVRPGMADEDELVLPGAPGPPGRWPDEDMPDDGPPLENPPPLLCVAPGWRWSPGLLNGDEDWLL